MTKTISRALFGQLAEMVLEGGMDNITLWQRTNSISPTGYDCRMTLVDCQNAQGAMRD